MKPYRTKAAPGEGQAKSLAEVLLAKGLLTPEQLERAETEAVASGRSLKRVLIQQGVMADKDMMAVVVEYSGVMSVELHDYAVKPEVVQLVPEVLARKHVAMPLFKVGGSLTVAIEDPFNQAAFEELQAATRCDIKPVVATERGIQEALNHYYSPSEAISRPEARAPASAAGSRADEEAAGEAPVIRLVNLLIMRAVEERASDIHIEPGENIVRTRFRIDGVLRQVDGPSTAQHSAVTSRIKVLANLDIAEKRKPQDGRFRLPLGGHDIDLRVSTIPTQFGEKVVMRLLDSDNAHLSLDLLGLDEQMRREIERMIHLPHGILLVTGPTGSGKTTTLYAALSAINSVERNIITIEDPVEYQLPGINQVQVNLKAAVTFASALRSFLRQDPDVIMVGEIRDQETAEIAIQAALTGHLVLSTLHTNDAPSSLTRLNEMGVEPFLIASSVVGILAQRLVRVICPACKTTYRLEGNGLKEFQAAGQHEWFRGGGCSACNRTGYRGRLAIFELLSMTPQIRELVASKEAAHLLRAAARQTGMRTLREDGIQKAQAGLTSLEEVLRVTQSE